MSKPRIVYRHGQLVEVETIEITGLPPSRPARQKDLFVKLPVAETVAVFTALGCPVALVWYALNFRKWAEKSDTIRMPTALLRSWGVKRKTWLGTLAARTRRVRSNGTPSWEVHSLSPPAVKIS
jgi:hypothetical protein